MRKIYIMLLGLLIFNIIISAAFLKMQPKIENWFVEQQRRIDAVKQISDCNLKIAVKELKQDIQDESATRVSYNWDLKRDIAELKRNIIELQIFKPRLVQNNFINSIQNTIDSVVHIRNITRGWQGSGVAWSKDIIITARHVIEGGANFEITLNNGIRIKAVKAISSEKYDVGFIKLDKFDPNYIKLKPAKFGSVKETVLGQSLYVIGSPYGKLNFNSITLGIVSGLSRNFDSLNYYDYYNTDYGWSVAFTTDSAGHPGNSGCPVFTMDGKVRGILVGGFSPVLIIVMPVDLFMNKLATIEMMFSQNEFYLEKEIHSSDYNYHSGM